MAGPLVPPPPTRFDDLRAELASWADADHAASRSVSGDTDRDRWSPTADVGLVVARTHGAIPSGSCCTLESNQPGDPGPLTVGGRVAGSGAVPTGTLFVLAGDTSPDDPGFEVEGAVWRRLQYHEGGATEFADVPGEFLLRNDFGTLRDVDPDLTVADTRSLRRFETHGERRRFAMQSGACRLHEEVVVYGVDVGAVHSGHFGFSRIGLGRSSEGSDPDRLVDELVSDLEGGGRVSLGFECPLSIPIPSSALLLGRSRQGESNRPWSAGAGCAVLALGLQQLTWVLAAVRTRLNHNPTPTFRWPAVISGPATMHLWEAFVSGPGRSTVQAHIDDARAAAEELTWRAVQLSLGQDLVSDINGHGLNLAAAAVLWSGLDTNPAALTEPITVIRANR